MFLYVLHMTRVPRTLLCCVAEHKEAICNCVHVKDDSADQFGLLLDGTNNRYKNIYEVVDCPQVINSSPTTKRIVKLIYSPSRETQRALCRERDDI